MYVSTKEPGKQISLVGSSFGLLSVPCAKLQSHAAIRLSLMRWIQAIPRRTGLGLLHSMCLKLFWGCWVALFQTQLRKGAISNLVPLRLACRPLCVRQNMRLPTHSSLRLLNPPNNFTRERARKGRTPSFEWI